jgi:hypothetical protein
MLLHLGDEGAGRAVAIPGRAPGDLGRGRRALDLERVVDVGQLARRELDVDHGARDLDHLAGGH